MGSGMTVMYTQFFSFPILSYILTPRLVLVAAGIALAAGVVGTLGSVRQAIVLPPAEAMRPEPPAQYGPTLLERLGLSHVFSNTTRMVLRHIERTPMKSAMSILGIAMAVGILIVGRSTADGIFYMISIVFDLQQRQEVTVSFIEPKGREALHAMANMSGVLHAEPFRTVSARIRHGHRSRRTGLMGLETDARLYQPLDENVKRIKLPEGGVLLSKKMAEMIGAKPGDRLIVEALEGTRPVREVVVSGLATEFLGTTPYMEIGSLNRMMEEGRLISGVHLVCDAKEVDQLYRRLKETPQVLGVLVKESAVNNFKKTMAETLLIMVAFQTAFSMVIAFGVIYNAARMAVAERGRELASLRVLGFTRAEISQILLGELAVLTATAIPLGLLMGHVTSMGVMKAFDTELFRIPFHLEPWTYGRAVLVVLVAAVVSGLLVRRKLDHLDLIAVLKTKE
jgi:putative ABC transport system permease protein